MSAAAILPSVTGTNDQSILGSLSSGDRSNVGNEGVPSGFTKSALNPSRNCSMGFVLPRIQSAAAALISSRPARSARWKIQMSPK